MNVQPLVRVLVVAVAVFAMSSVRADAPRAAATDPRGQAQTAFDRGADLLAKDPGAAKVQLAKSVDAFERLLSGPLAQHDRAELLYNLGCARQLAGDNGLAVLAFRRAELLAPDIPGLREHLAAARAAAKGESPAPAATAVSASLLPVARDWALSLPRRWLWRTAAVAYIAFWTVVLLRLLLARAVWRPRAAVLIAIGAAFAVPIGLLAVEWKDQSRAAAQAVVLAETSGRTQPDNLTAESNSPGPLRPGTEVAILDTRTGGDGQPWIRIRPIDSGSDPADSGSWVPASALSPITER